jgi:single-strand DNA-binding protein
MANDAHFDVTGYVATQPKVGMTRNGVCWVSMRVAWTPRAIDKTTGEWTDQQTSFVSVMCYRKVAENAALCLRTGDPVMLRGTLQVREYDDKAGVRRYSVDVVADSLGHDMSRGLSHYSKSPQRTGQTAQEYGSSTAAERSPLPGDVAAAAGRAGGQPFGDEPDPDDPDDEQDPADVAELASGQPETD